MKHGKATEELMLLASVTRLLLGILDEVARGNTVAVSLIEAELTTAQAAEILNVSRPHISKLIDQGVISSRKVGSHRRVMLVDVLAYKKEMYTKRHAVLEELSALDQELGLY